MISLIFPLHSLFMFNITSEYSRFAMWGVHIQNAAYNHWVPIPWRIKTLSLYAAVQSRCLLSLTGNRASANRSQPLKQLSRFVCHRVPSDWHSLYALIHRNGITLPRLVRQTHFSFSRKSTTKVMACHKCITQCKSTILFYKSGCNRMFLSLFNRQVWSY